jgi:DNA-directed RNA polymerase subunit M/transcription elongation factor TFIIS
MDDVDMRGVIRAVLTSTLDQIVNTVWVSKFQKVNGVKFSHENIADLVNTLEEIVFDYSKNAEEPQQTYPQIIETLNKYLSASDGIFPSNIFGLQYLSGRSTATCINDALTYEYTDPTPRDIILRMFVKTLSNSHQSFHDDRKLAVQTASDIELSCFNAAVRMCKNSENPPRRQWDSPQFKDIYSTRCGTVNILLDVDSSTCREYGSDLIPGLINGTISRHDVGDCTPKNICPQATARETAVIVNRSKQKVSQKPSALFMCPHCHVRKCNFQTVQRRALDEAPDYLCLCLNCDKRFTGRE